MILLNNYNKRNLNEV